MIRGHRYFLYHNNSGGFSEISDGTICGRVEGQLTFPEDNLISRRHCRFTIAGSEVYVEDFGSKNRTRVNGVPIQPGRRRKVLLHDVIEFGSQRLILTNRDGYCPQNTQDVGTPDPYQGIEKSDGSITVVTGSLQTREGAREHTLVELDRPTYRKLKAKRTVRQTLEPLRKEGSRSRAVALAFGALLVLGALGWGFREEIQEGVALVQAGLERGLAVSSQEGPPK